MNSSDKIKSLAGMLQSRLLPLIGKEYVLYGLPYYSNIGDTLIWEGTLQMLRHGDSRCRGVCGWDRYPMRPLPEDVTILIQGGGYFGDVWRKAWERVLGELAIHKDNRVVILPSSIWYDDPAVLEKDVRLLSGIKKLVICARDSRSYDFARAHFDNETLLAPDMAFAIDPETLSEWILPETRDCLYLKRNDKEFVERHVHIPAPADVADWPTMSDSSLRERLVYGIDIASKMVRKIPLVSRAAGALNDSAYYHIYRKEMLSRGVQFISPYRTVYTTRLHGLVLSALLDKQTFFLDNSYGKVSALYSTWLQDTDNIKPAADVR